MSRRGIARCVVSVEILPRNSAKTTCTTSPEQIEVIKLEGYSGTMLEGRMAADSAASYVELGRRTADTRTVWSWCTDYSPEDSSSSSSSSLTRSQLGP